MEKKGQSALEYLMTYGWALVVIVIVIAALVFLIQPSQVGANTCSPTSGILITNHQVSAATDNMQLILSNQSGTTLSDVNVSITGTAGTTNVTASPQPTVITSLGTTSQTQTVTLTPGFAAGQYSLTVAFGYKDRDGLSRTVTSTCNGTAS